MGEKFVPFTQDDEKWVHHVVEKFLKECQEEKINPLAIHAALTILLKSCNDELRKDGIIVECYTEEMPGDQTIN